MTRIGAAAVWSATSHAQDRVRVISILETISPELNAANMDALRRGLRELGYTEGQNLRLEYRFAEGQARRFPALVAELVRLKVELIVTRGTPAALAAKQATSIIPVVMAAIGEPVDTGGRCEASATRWQRDGIQCPCHGACGQAR
jgi:putative tryptophan/tyrosine transport system substrate-binding protein